MSTDPPSFYRLLLYVLRVQCFEVALLFSRWHFYSYVMLCPVHRFYTFGDFHIPSSSSWTISCKKLSLQRTTGPPGGLCSAPCVFCAEQSLPFLRLQGPALFSRIFSFSFYLLFPDRVFISDCISVLGSCAGKIQGCHHLTLEPVKQEQRHTPH